MKITNNHNYHDILVQAVQNDDYDAPKEIDGVPVISVTTLIGGPRAWNLRRIHEEDLTRDVSDSIWALFGTMMHGILERADSSYIKEVRINKLIKLNDNQSFYLSGKFDLYDYRKKELQDWKYTSKYNSDKQGYYWQLNILRWLINSEIGLDVQSLQLNLIYRDWNNKDKFADNMPKYNYESVPVPILKDSVTERYIMDKLLRYILNDVCNPEERWNRGHWKIVDNNGKIIKGHSNYKSEKEANTVNFEVKGNVEYVEGKDAKCERYCDVNRWCDYHQNKLLDNIKVDETV